MSKVKITKKQAEFIEGFKKLYYNDNQKTVEVAEILPTWASCALRNLTQFGFGKGLEDANGKEVSEENNYQEDDFGHEQVPLLIEAIMHGYEIEEEKVVLFIEFNDAGHYGKRKIYYGAGTHTTNKFNATEYDLSVEWKAKKVEELKAKGWEVEEVK